MEFKELLQIFQKNSKFILLVSCLTALLAGLINNFLPIVYKASFAVTVTQKQIDKTSDYKFDNYYSFEAINTFTESLEKWFKNPQIIKTALLKSNVSLENLKIHPASLFKARKLAPNYIEVGFKFEDSDKMGVLVNNLVGVLNEEVAKLKQEKDVWYEIIATSPYIEKANFNNTTIAFIAFLNGFFFSALFFIIKHYFKASK